MSVSSEQSVATVCFQSKHPYVRGREATKMNDKAPEINIFILLFCSQERNAKQNKNKKIFKNVFHVVRKCIKSYTIREEPSEVKCPRFCFCRRPLLFLGHFLKRERERKQTQVSYHLNLLVCRYNENSLSITS